MQDRSRRIDALLSWLRERGAVFPKIAVVCSDEGASVVAKEALVENEVIVQLPWDCVLSQTEAQRSELSSSLAATGVGVHGQIQLAVHLLEARHRSDSPWRAYLDALPKSYDAMPIFYDAEHLAYLQGSYALDAVLSRNRRYRNEYRKFVEAMPDFARYSLEDYRWARTVVATRCFRVKTGDDEERAMLPLIDLINHRLAASSKWGVRTGTDGVACWVTRRIGVGEEIFVSYGAQPLSRHFIAYGFLNPDRRHDDARIVMTLDSTDPLYETKSRLLPVALRKHHFVSLRYDSSFREILAIARLIHLNTLEGETADAITAQRPISLANERAALREVANACDCALSLFPTTVAADRAFIERFGGTEDSWVLAAVEFSLREKCVLVDCLAFLRAALEGVNLDLPARHASLEAYPEDSAIRAYLEEVGALS